jgi:hypothetical protein
MRNFIKFFSLSVILLAPLGSALAHTDRVVLAELLGTTTLNNEQVECAARLMQYKEERFLEFEVDGRSQDFDLKEESEKLWKGEFQRQVPGSGGFGSYTPAEKSKGTMSVELDAEEPTAKVMVENCVERTFLGTGTGTFRCRTTRFTCVEN